MTAYNNDSLYNALKELDVIEPAALDNTYQQSKSANTSFEVELVEKDLIGDENLGKIIADLMSLPYVNLSKVAIAKDILNIVPEIVAKKQKVIAFDRGEKGLKLAINDPSNTEVVDFIKKKTGHEIVLYYATSSDMDKAMALYHKDLKQTFDELLKEKVAHATKSNAGEAPIREIVDLLVQYAYENRSSDMHIEPEKNKSIVRFRIDGVLHDVLDLPKELHDQVVARIKVAAKLKTDEHFSAQDGKMQEKLPDEDLDIRVSIVPITNGEKAVLRLLSSHSRQFAFSDLGISTRDLSKIRDGFTKPYGMVLSTGPTGSGKTTTIYSILKILNTRSVNIATIEDPVEYEIEGVNQIQVNPKTNLTFAQGLRSILRQDPNIIFVGEIRDPETASIAVNSATTGHMVLSTLHTNDAATTLPRLLDMGVEPYLVASTVNVIVAQRLVRRICEKCRHSIDLDLKELEKSINPAVIKRVFGTLEKPVVYQGKGCQVCHNTGFVGRVGIFEVMVMDNQLRDLVVSKADADTLRNKAIELGMITMLEDGLEKVQQGFTTIEEILRATKE